MPKVLVSPLSSTNDVVTGTIWSVTWIVPANVPSPVGLTVWSMIVALAFGDNVSNFAATGFELVPPVFGADLLSKVTVCLVAEVPLKLMEMRVIEIFLLALPLSPRMSVELV